MTSPPQHSGSEEACSSSRGRLVARLYPHLPNRLKPLARRMMASFEGGEMISASLRQTMQVHHRMEIGLHSYGCFDPARFSDCRIGRYVSIGPGVRVFRRNHPTDRISLHPYFYNTQLGVTETETMPPSSLHILDDVWIGANALLLPGCGRIGRGAVIGAGAVVTRDVPDFAIAAGNPARVIRDRFPASIQQLLQDTQWWTKSRDRLATALPLLQQPADGERVITFQNRISDV